MRKTLAYSLLIASFALLTGCRLAVMMTSGGDANSLSGIRDCTGPAVCEFEITSSSFSETFTATANPGYEFVKWSDGAGFQCAGSTSPSCTVSLPPEPWASAIVALFDIGYIMPIFKHVGIDTDGDGIRNELDEDDDGDGLPDNEDACPLDPNLGCGINEVGGVILEDTTWTSENGPLEIVEPVQVANGVTLTISEGVNFVGDGYIGVAGRLVIRGTVSNPVVGLQTSVWPVSDPLATEPFLIDIEHARLRTAFSNFTSAAQGGSWVLRHSVFDERNADCSCSARLDPTEDTIIEYNVFRGPEDLNIWFRSAVDIVVRNNVFEAEGLLFLSSTGGSLSPDASLVLEHNTFLRVDSYFGGGPYEGPVLKWFDGLNAANNYWGTTDTSVIDGMLEDRSDDISIGGFIDYLPILTAPHPDTPSL